MAALHRFRSVNALCVTLISTFCRLSQQNSKPTDESDEEFIQRLFAELEEAELPQYGGKAKAVRHNPIEYYAD